MSFGNSYNGGRTRMKTKVLLNVYDLSPANDYLVPLGLGFHHSGIEILGREYSFGSGAGIFDSPPKEAFGAKFRFQIDLGSYDGGSKELTQALDELATKFGPSDYDLVGRNCNHFGNALAWQLLRRPIPAYVNRWADIGNCCSCLLPKKMLDGSPVDGSPEAGNGAFAPSGGPMQRGGNESSAFSGAGQSLGGSMENSSEGLLSKWTRSSPPASNADDLTDRREKARKAAMARMERNQTQVDAGKQS